MKKPFFHGKSFFFPYLLAFFAVIFLEVFLFNFRYWQSRTYTPIEIPLEDCYFTELYGKDEAGNYIFISETGEPGTVTIDLSTFRESIHNIAIRSDLPAMEASYYFVASPVSVPFSIDMAQINIVSVRGDGEKMLPVRYFQQGNGKLTVFALPESNGANALAIRIRSMYESSNCPTAITKCYLNVPVPFAFSFIRVILLSLILCVLLVFRPSSELWQIPLYRETNGIDRRVYVGLFLGILVTTAAFYMLARTNVLFSTDQEVRGFYSDLARAISHGQVSIEQTPDPVLETLSDPYDYKQREAAGVDYLLDYSYYEGKYYVYFGVIPCLLFYLPVRLIFGVDALSWKVLVFFCPVFMTGLAILIKELFERYRKDASVALFSLTYFFSAISISLTTIAANAITYYVPMLAAVIFFVYGFAFYLIYVRKTEEGKEAGGSLAVGSLCMAFIAGCRPQLVLAAVIALPILLPKLIGFPEDKKISFRWKRIFCFVIPYVIVAAGLMWYNQIRFGSVFQFGADYSLTIARVNKGVYMENIIAGLQYYLFHIPEIKDSFPFVTYNTIPWDNPHGIANGVMGYGLFLAYPILFLSFATLLYRGETKQEREMATIARILAALGLLFNVIASNMVGLIGRYQLDMAIFFALSSALMLMKYRPAILGKHRKCAIWILTIVCCTSLIQWMMAYFTPMGLIDMKESSQHFYANTAHLVEFWW